MMKKHLLLIIFQILFVAGYAQTTIISDGTDCAIQKHMNPAVSLDTVVAWNGDSKPRAGGGVNWQNAEDSYEGALVFPFQIPAIPDGMEVGTASFKFTVERNAAWGAHSYDLYALPYRTASTVLKTDFYSGTYNNDPNALAIQAAIATNANLAAEVVTTSTDANGIIVNYINAQISQGAKEGDFIFFRINADVEDAVSYAEMGIYSAEHTEETAKPTLVLTFSNPAGNTTPVLDPIGAIYAIDGEASSVTISASDADLDALSFSISGEPTFVTLTDNSDGTASINISDASTIGTYSNIVIEVSDGTDTDSETIELQVVSSIMIYADTLDRGIYMHNGSRSDTTLEWYQNPVPRVGGGVNHLDATDTYEQCIVMPFKMPAIPAGKVVVDADFSVYLKVLAGWAAQNYDLYAIPYRETNDVLTTDFYVGYFGGNTGDHPLEQIFADQTTTEGFKTTTEKMTKQFLAKYINEQIAAGAEEGDWLFIRISCDNPDAHEYGNMEVRSGNSTEKPYLTVKFGNASTLNNVPVVSSIDNVTVGEGNGTNFNVSVTDADAGDEINFSLIGVPATVTVEKIDNSSATISVAENTQPGVYGNATLVATDGKDVASESFSITVTDDAELHISKGSWLNLAQEELNGGIIVKFDAVPGAADMDGIIGISEDPAAGYGDNACIVRFNTSGEIDVHNGTTYASENTVAYTAGANYHFKIKIHVPSKTYSVFVTDESEVTTTLASDYGFRAQADTLANVVITANNSYHKVSNISFLEALAIISLKDTAIGAGITLNLDVAATSASDDLLSLSIADDSPAFVTLTDNGDGTGKLSLAPAADAAGTYNIKVKVADESGNSDSTSFSLTVLAPPVADAGPDQTVTEGDRVTLDAINSTSDGTIVNYSWSKNEVVLLEGSNRIQFITDTLSTGDHEIILTVTDNGGGSDTDTVIVTVNPVVSVNNKYAGADISVYPNPVNKGEVAVTVSNRISSTDFEVELVNTVGQIMHKITVEAHVNKFYLNNLSEIQKGIYFLRIDAPGGHAVKRLVIQ